MVNDAMEPVIVWGMQPLWGIASASPFCLKLETWLRMAGLPYEAKALTGPGKSKTGKVPYVERPDGTVLADSGVIVDTLTLEHGVTLDAGLTDEERATAHLVRRTLEESLYFALLWDRWIDDEHWKTTGPDYFRPLPWPVRALVPGFARRMVRGYLHGQGIGRHDPARIRAMGVVDIDAVATVLGDREWFFGRPTTTDAIAFGFFANLLAAPIEGPMKEAVRARPNLVAHTERMTAAYWGR
jgi:glutathione S-transferase